MKVAFVIDDSLDKPDGVQAYVRSLAAYLGKAGHEVHVLCSGAAGEPPPGVTAVHSVTRNVGVNFNGNSLRTPVPASRSRIRALLEAQRFDVIHVMSPHSPFFAARVVDEARALQARTVRIVGSFVILPDGRTSDFGTRALGKALRRNVRRFDAFTGLSGPATEFATAAYGVECVTSPAPIDVEAMRAQAQAKPWAAPAGGGVVVAFLGRLVERKGVLELVEALAAIPYTLRENLQVRIGGRGPLLEQVKAAVESHGLADVVTLEGFVSDEDKAGFLAAADIAVFPATGGESFGIVLIEAMAAGSGAVLAGNNPGYAWTMDDPQAVVDPTNAESFAAALTALISNPHERAALHARQQQRVAEFDLSTVGQQIETVYGWR
jgi:phosphatidylinositol alpha-mannosyltransferase